MKSILASLLALGLALAPAASSWAQQAPVAQMKPILVVAFSGYDAFKDDLNFIGSLAGNPALADLLEQKLEAETGGQGLAGLDKTRPWGAAVRTDGLQIQPLALLPVDDLEKLFGAVAGMIPDPEDAGDGVWEIAAGPVSVFVKQQGKWALIGQTKESLRNLPEDPAKLLAPLASQYDLALRLSMQNIPPMFRQMAADQIRLGMILAIRPQDGEDDEQFAQRRKIVERQIEATITALSDLDELSIGLSIDGENRKAVVDLSSTAVVGSKTAELLAAVSTEKSAFSGFTLPGALISAHVNRPTSEQDMAQTREALKYLEQAATKEIDQSGQLADPQQKALLKGFLAEFIQVIDRTTAQGRINGGLVVTARAPHTLAVGGMVADGQKLESILKRFVDAAADDPGFPKVELDVEHHRGIRFHRLEVPVPENDDNLVMRELFGDPLEVTLGFGPSSVFFALGKDGRQTIKQVLDKSLAEPAVVPPIQVNLAAGPLLQMIAQRGQPQPIAIMLAQMLQGTGKDGIRLVAQPQERGVVYRIELQEGILQLIGTGLSIGAAQAAGRL